jgi:hypothetical protein
VAGIAALVEVAAAVQPVPAPRWTAPIGVPPPSFGIAQQAPSPPSPWTVETAGFYFVDSTHPRASDTVSYGTPTQPRRSIPAVVPAGSLVEVRGGPYTTPVSIGGPGTAAAPIFYRGVSKPALQSDIPRRRRLDVTGSYVIVEGFDFVNTFASLLGTHLAIRDNEIRDQAIAPGGCGVCTRSSSDVVIFRNHIHHNGDATMSRPNDIHGVQVAAGAQRIWIVDNHIHHNGGDSVQINSGRAGPLARFIYIGRNEMHHDRENAVDIKQAADVIVSQNTCYAYRPTTGRGSDGTAIVINDDNASNGQDNRIWILFNRVRESSNAVRAQAYGYLLGNVFSDVSGAGLVSFGRHNDHVEHNTMLRVGAGIQRWGGGPGVKTDVISNVIQGVREVAVALRGPAAGESTLANLVLDKGARLRLEGRRGAGACAGCVESPMLFSGGQSEPRVATGSRLPTAEPSSIYARFAATYKVDIAVAADGTPRPAIGPWTVGAFQMPPTPGANGAR